MVKNLGKSIQREQFHERYRFGVKNVALTRQIYVIALSFQIVDPIRLE